MRFDHLALRQLALGAMAASALAAAVPAWAENHALILWIGDYGDPRSNLPGIDRDAAHARTIARAMGVPDRNISEISNGQLTRAAFGAQLSSLQQRIKDGDKVFLYFSGHGGQRPGQGTAAACTEGLVARDGLVLDAVLQNELTTLGRKASQVVMMNDSCFSGGAATRSALPAEPGAVPKFLPPGVGVNTAVSGGYTCGQATNMNRVTRSLDVMARDGRGPQVLYIASSADTEVSFAGQNGSAATVAWAACISAANADKDRSGRINGEELRECAQASLNRRGTKQTIMLQGNTRLPLSFVQPVAAAPAPAPAPVAAPAPVPAVPPVAVNAAQALHDLRAGADRSLPVQLTMARSSLRIGKDNLDFTVATEREGYLYLLQVGSDGKTFNLLFPNKIDASNFLPAGAHRFPRPSWILQAGGPAGKSHVLAIVSTVRKELSRNMDGSSVFATVSATQGATRTLVIAATGADGGSGRYGASEVVTIEEVD